jgi:ribosomal protein S27AE
MNTLLREDSSAMNDVYITENWRPNRSTLDPSSMIQIDKDSKKVRVFFEVFPFDCYMILARNKDQPNVTTKIWFSFMTDIGDRIIKFHRFAKEHISDEWWEQETLPEIPIPWNIIYEMEGETWQEIIKKLDDLIFEIKKTLGRLYDGKIKGMSNHWEIILSRDEFVETIYGEIKKRLNPPLESHPIRLHQESVTHPPTEANVPNKSLLCPKCGKVISNNSNRCSYCGKFIPTAYLLITSTEDEKEERKLLES